MDLNSVFGFWFYHSRSGTTIATQQQNCGDCSADTNVSGGARSAACQGMAVKQKAQWQA